MSYATNGITTLTYVLAITKDGVTELGELKTANFNVPKVQGTIPSYPYIVEFYLADKESKDENDNYTKYNKADNDTTEPTYVKLHSSISIESIDVNYKDKYLKDNYTFAKGNTSLQIKAEENVIKPYYNPILVDVKVTHNVTTTVYDEDGNKTERIEEPIVVNESKLYKGDKYTATLLGENYTLLETSDPYKDVILKKNVNKINLNYRRIEDHRAGASVKVNHKYTTKTWTLENGKYVLKESTILGTSDEIANLRATATYTIKPKLDNFEVTSITPSVSANDDGNYVV